jgi:hypothetical protein
MSETNDWLRIFLTFALPWGIGIGGRLAPRWLFSCYMVMTMMPYSRHSIQPAQSSCGNRDHLQPGERMVQYWLLYRPSNPLDAPTHRRFERGT